MPWTPRSAQSLAAVSLVVATSLLASCGGGTDSGTQDTSLAPGTLVDSPPPRVAPISAAQLSATLSATASGAALLEVAGAPTCGVDVFYFTYGTVGAAGEAVSATGALMVPSGAGATCSGPRPVVLYAHGTTPDRSYDMADIQNNSEGALVAAFFAAQGYIVVAPNYAGYDASTLPYHPFVNASQQSSDMINALTAARAALTVPSLDTTNLGAARVSDNAKLFITGYSEGGFVAMATHRALQAAGKTVTASAPMSGPYALEAFGDSLFLGSVDIGGTVFAPLLTTSYQKAYGNIYSATTDVYDPAYATGIDTLLPSLTPIATLFQQGKLPQTALFESTPPTAPAGSPASLQLELNAVTSPTLLPIGALGFGSPGLVNNTFRLAYLLDAFANPDGGIPTLTTGLPAATPGNPLRQAFKTNDLRNWAPTSPTLLCGGINDPTVYYLNTQLMQGLWSAPSPLALPTGLLTVVNVDTTPPSGTFASAEGGFALAEAAVAAAAVAAGATDGGASAVAQAYHGTLVPPFCTAVARSFFGNF